MWDEIFAELSADQVSSSISKKDDRGITRTVKPANPVKGDILDDANWQAAVKGGATMTEKGRSDDGATRNRNGKDLTSKQAQLALNKLLGIKTKARSTVADTVEPSTNGQPQTATA